MHAALSVLLLTTLIGAGQGLLIALVVVEIAARAQGGPEGVRALLVAGAVLSFLLCGGGLVASFFHLGHPERAWRAAARWRSSWLSREVIVLPAFMGAVALYGLAHATGTGPTLTIGLAGVALALALYVCTGMIYAAVHAIAEWAHPLTVVNYTLLGAASGTTIAAALAALLGQPSAGALAAAAIGLTLLGAVTRIAALVRNDRLVPRTTLQTALGIRHPAIVQKAQGAMGGSFNTREFFHGASAQRMRQIRAGFPLLAFALPVLLLAAGGTIALVAAVALQMLGLIAERWVFFAQANHPQNLYYRSIA